MDSKVYHKGEIKQAAEELRNGKLVAFPTETVYGLGADVENDEAVKKVFAAKGRPSDNPLIVHVSDFEMVKRYVDDVPKSAIDLTEHFWPGPLTIVLNIREGVLPESVTGGLKTAAFRMPNHPMTLAFIQEVGHGIVGPSANTSGKPSPTEVNHVLHDMNGKISGVLDGGASYIGVESTVVDLTTHGVATILRPGAITEEMLKGLVGHVQVDQHLVDAAETPIAPGMKYTHYSPNARVVIVSPTISEFKKAVQEFLKKNLRVGVLADQEIVEKLEGEMIESFVLSEFHNVRYATKNLFKGLRALDEKGVDVIFIESFAEVGLGIALMNRIKKAAGNAWYAEGNL